MTDEEERASHARLEQLAARAPHSVHRIYAAFDVECLASKPIADQVPVEHVRDKKDQAKNIE